MIARLRGVDQDYRALNISVYSIKVAFCTTSIPNSAQTLSRAIALSVVLTCTFDISMARASANAWGFRGGTSNPVLRSCTTSLHPGTSVATSAQLQAAASSSTEGVPSPYDGRHTMCALA